MSADDIIITNIEDTTDGLQVTFVVRGMSGGVITAQAVAEAIQVSIFEGLISGLTQTEPNTGNFSCYTIMDYIPTMNYGDFLHFSLLLEVFTTL